jgi:hypothetical protein
VKVNLLILVSLLILAACGGGKGAVKLEVTRSFSSTNSTFDGGLYIVGKNTSNGDEFAVSLTTQSSTSLNLNYGNWEIKVIGWDNYIDKLFEGDILCGSTTINFKKEVDSAPITVSSSACADLNPKILKLYTCSALYNPSSPNELISGTSLSDTFCNVYPQAWQNQAKGLKISLLDKLPGENFSEGITSICLPATTASTNKYLSTKLPLKITLYDDKDCLTAKKIGSYEFPKGLDEYSRTSHPFDAIIATNDNGEALLALPTNISKRGISPFLTEIPSFNCGTNGYCFQLPNLPSGTNYHYVLSHGFNSILLKPSSPMECGEVKFISSMSQSNDNDIEMKECFKDPVSEELILNLEVKYNATAESNKFFSVDNGTNKKYVMINSPAVQTFRTLKEVIGTPFTDNQIKKSFIEYNNEGPSGNNESKGMLSDPIDILSPAKVGGVFWDQTCSTTPMSAAIKRSITFFDEGIKTYQIILTNPPSDSIPQFIGYQTDSWGETISQNFHRRIIIRSFHGPVGYKTEMLMDIVCDGVSSLTSTGAIKIGRFESYHSSQDDTKSKSETSRKVIFWNTADSHKARFENYEAREEVDISTTTPTPKRKYNSFTRAEKHGTASNVDKTKITQLNYSYESGSDNASSWQRESLHQNEIDMEGTNITVYPKVRLEKQNQTIGSIFTDEANTTQLNRIRYNNEDPNNKTKVLSTGEMVSVKNLSGTLQIQYFDGITTTTTSLQPSQTATSKLTFDLDISPDGKKVIVVSGTNESHLIESKIFNGSSWNSHETMIPIYTGTSGINKIKGRILNNGIIAVAAISSSNQLYFGINTSSTSNQLPSVTSEFGSMDTTSGSQAGGSASQSYNSVPIISEVDMAKDGSNFWIFRKFQMTNTISGTTNTIIGINYCIINTSNPGCTPSTSTTTGNIFSVQDSTYSSPDSNQTPFKPYDFSIYNSEDLKTIRISYNLTTITQNGTTQNIVKNKTWLINSSGTSFSETNSDPIYQEGMTSINLTTTSFTPPTAPPTILFYSPFQKPSVPNFKMNFMGLKAGIFESTVFTEKNTFQAIGNGL